MQQINLYQPSLHKKTSHMTVSRVGQYAAGLAGLMVIISAVQSGLYYSARQELSTIKQQQQTLLAEVQQASNELTGMSDDSDLQAALARKERELTNKQKVLVALSGKQFGNVQGFAEQFTGLARQHIDGLWLTGLYIHAGGQKLNLKGSTFSPEKVPKYLQNLSAEPSFRGMEFKSFLMERAETSAKVNFDIRSNQAEPAL